MSHPQISPVRQEDDRIRGVVVFLIIAAATLFAIICVMASWILWRVNISAFNPAGLERVKEVEVKPPAIWGVNQTLINVDTATRRINEESRRRLESHRWIDREAGVAQIPIGEAMRAVAAGGIDALGGTGPGAAGAAGGQGLVR